jgi:hypothetical protein
MTIDTPKGYALTTVARPSRRQARTAGLLYLVIAVVGAFSIAYVPSVIVVADDAARTAANLLANPALFGLGVLADVIVMLAEIALTVLLYVLLKPASPTLSLIAMVSRLMMVAVMAINLLIYVMPQVLLRAAADPLGPGLLSAVSMLFEAHRYGIFVWDIFFGFHLMALGLLLVRSAAIPGLLGGAILVGSLGYLLEGLTKVTGLANPELGMAIVALLVVASIGELVFALWLLIRGVAATRA